MHCWILMMRFWILTRWKRSRRETNVPPFMSTNKATLREAFYFVAEYHEYGALHFVLFMTNLWRLLVRASKFPCTEMWSLRWNIRCFVCCHQVVAILRSGSISHSTPMMWKHSIWTRWLIAVFSSWSIHNAVWLRWHPSGLRVPLFNITGRRNCFSWLPPKTLR